MAKEAARRLAGTYLDEHIGFIDTVSRDDHDVVLVEVRRELRPRLTPSIVAALSGLPFRLRDARIPDGAFYDTDDGLDDDVPGVIVEPILDDRPELVQELHRCLDAAGLGDVGISVAMHRRDGTESLEIRVSHHAPVEIETTMARCLQDMPIDRTYRQQAPRTS